MAVNKVIILGNLGADPERVSEAMIKFSVATTKKWNDKQTQEPREKTEWHNVVAFHNVADIIEKYFNKGSQIYLEGELQYSEKDGKYYTNIVLQNFSFVGTKTDNNDPF